MGGLELSIIALSDATHCFDPLIELNEPIVKKAVCKKTIKRRDVLC